MCNTGQSVFVMPFCTDECRTCSMLGAGIVALAQCNSKDDAVEDNSAVHEPKNAMKLTHI